MKRLIFVFVLSFIYFSVGFSQLNEFFRCDNTIKELYPSITEITERFQKEVERRTPPRGYSIHNKISKNIGQTSLEEDEIEKLRTILLLSIYPDTTSLCKNELHTAVDKEKLLLWNDGYIHPWYFSKDSKKLVSYGGSGAMPFKNFVDIVSFDECMYFVYFLPKEKNFYHYFAYKKNGQYIIVDKEGNEFDNLKVLIDKKYGSYKDYIELFKKPYP